MGKKAGEKWIIEAEQRRLRKRHGSLLPKDVTMLQVLNITQQQIAMKHELELYPKYGKEVGLAALKFKRKGLVDYSKMSFVKEHGAYRIIGLQLTTKGMKALTKGGGTVFLNTPR